MKAYIFRRRADRPLRWIDEPKLMRLREMGIVVARDISGLFWAIDEIGDPFDFEVLQITNKKLSFGLLVHTWLAPDEDEPGYFEEPEMDVRHLFTAGTISTFLKGPLDDMAFKRFSGSSANPKLITIEEQNMQEPISIDHEDVISVIQAATGLVVIQEDDRIYLEIEKDENVTTIGKIMLIMCLGRAFKSATDVLAICLDVSIEQLQIASALNQGAHECQSESETTH